MVVMKIVLGALKRLDRVYWWSCEVTETLVCKVDRTSCIITYMESLIS